MDYIQTTLEKDLEGILEVARYSFNDFYPTQKLLKRAEGKKIWTYVVKDGERIVGFKIWYKDDDGDIYNWLDAVHPDYQRRGISSKLFSIMFDMSRKEGYSEIKLKTHEGHPKMIALCKKLGFVEVHRAPHHWKDTIDREAIFFEYNLLRHKDLNS